MPATSVPIQHPDYRYPTLRRNPYAEKLKDFPGWAYADNETEAYAGQWREKFRDFAPGAPRRELHFEIGCNTGHVVRAWAERNPHADFIGIDWKFKIIHRGVEKAQAKGLKNLIFFRANVERVRYMFAPGELDFAYLYFPDPWPKKGQNKNRFIKAESLRDLARVMRTGGVFHIKTDHDGYFQWMEEAIAEVTDLWDVTEKTYDLHAGISREAALKLDIPEVTLFEKLFIRDGINIKSVKLVRK